MPQDAGNRKFRIMDRPLISPKNAFWISGVLAIVFLAQGVFGSLEKSLTWDEPTFIASGYTYLTRDDFRLNPMAPPLMQQLEALPLLSMNLSVPAEAHPAWQRGNHIGFARQFILENAPRIREIAFRARLPVLLLGSVLILAIYLWGQRLYGPVPALVATATAALSPNLLAHAKLATTDFGCTVFMCLSVWAFWQSIQTRKKRHWALCGLITGLALLSKFTGLLLGPTYLALAVVHLARKRSEAIPLTVGLLIAGGVALLTVGAGYNLSLNPMRYVEGLRSIYADTSQRYQFYLLGNVSDHPWWYYHIAAFLLKVPLPTLGLIALALVSLFRDARHRDAALYLLIPVLVVLGASCFDRANLGLRRILPAFPFLFLFTAQALAGPQDRWRAWVAACLIAWLGIEAARIYPHHLAYFNSAAGGPERGPYLLDDSNIDWGQDLPSLATWQQTHPEADPLKLFYFGNVPPAAYGVHAADMAEQDIIRPQPGAYAISAHHLAWFRKLKKQSGRDIDWLTRYRPVARAGYSIYIYRFP